MKLLGAMRDVLTPQDVLVCAVALGWAIAFLLEALGQREWNDGYAAGAAGAKLQRRLEDLAPDEAHHVLGEAVP